MDLIIHKLHKSVRAEDGAEYQNDKWLKNVQRTNKDSIYKTNTE